jgi:hypothetical protein
MAEGFRCGENRVQAGGAGEVAVAQWATITCPYSYKKYELHLRSTSKRLEKPFNIVQLTSDSGAICLSVCSQLGWKHLSLMFEKACQAEAT